MNERIKELIKQATEHDYTTWDSYNQKELVYYKFNQEKFAELIVRECAELSVNSQYVNTKSEYYEGFNEALIYAGNKIKQHFGVE
jgi:hypothetical protein